MLTSIPFGSRYSMSRIVIDRPALSDCGLVYVGTQAEVDVYGLLP